MHLHSALSKFCSSIYGVLEYLYDDFSPDSAWISFFKAQCVSNGCKHIRSAPLPTCSEPA